MADLWKLPPPPPSRPRASLPGATALPAVGGPSQAWIDRDDPAPDPAAGRLVRRSRMGMDEADAHAAAWVRNAPPAAPMAVRAGVRAWERRRPDVAAPGWRRQRLALGPPGAVVEVLHWSVPDPPTTADEDHWRAMTAAMVRVEERGWRA